VPPVSPPAGPTSPPADVPRTREEVLRTEEDGLRTKEQAENFPVAQRLLPAALRTDLRAVYDVVRTIDDLGDEEPGDADPEHGDEPGVRLTRLTAFADDLARVWSTGAPQAPVLLRLVPTVRRHDIPSGPFDRLIRANIIDQQVSRYETFSDLLGYCDLSAAPIGELVLRLFDRATPDRIALSDRVCAALQVAEHLQDVGEDRRRGRVYLPQEDLAAAGVPESDLDAVQTSPALRRLVLAECDKVTELLAAGPPLLASLSGWARLAVTGYVAGGHAAVDGLRRTGGDVLTGSPGVRRRDLLRQLARTALATRGAAR
jgi:squalene synthase HpnC